MADRLFLSNDNYTASRPAGGYEYDNEVFIANILANEASAHPASSNTLIPLFTAKQNGRITDVWIGVTQPACSASGFVSGSVSATVNINSAACLSTVPAVVAPALSANIVRGTTNAAPNSAFISAVVNAASATFSTGDQISYNWTTQSAGSAAAGAAGKGLVLGVRVRYTSR